jgi:hypothetical protein
VIAIAQSSRWSAQDSVREQRERHAKPNTHHEVVAARAGHFSGSFIIIYWSNDDSHLKF